MIRRGLLLNSLVFLAIEGVPIALRTLFALVGLGAWFSLYLARP